MSSSETSLHNVLQATVEPVMANPSGEIRWQRILIHLEDGSEHRVVCFLHPLASGLPATPRNRIDDVPRQPALIPE